MTKSKPDDSLRLIADRYRALHEALASDRGMPRNKAERQLLTDRVRDALDRMSAEFSPSASPIIANSFWQDCLLHDSETTQIWRLRHRDLDQFHAMKTVNPGQADSPEARGRLLRESAILSSISHPAVIRHHMTLRLQDGRPGLILEYLPSSLAGIGQPNPYSADDIAQLMGSLLSGLEAVHAAGYVHADICPANLLTGAQNGSGLKIADFGISVPIGTTHQAAGYNRAFSPEFAAPEQIAGKPVDARTDIFAAGRVLAYLIEHAALSTMETEAFRQVVTHFTGTDPELRPQSASEGREILGGYVLAA